MQSPDESYQPRDRRPWTEEEDEILRLAIEEEDPDCNPPTRWHAISQHIPNRTNKDCRKRWWAQMATVVSKGSWTSDEDERLCSAVDELGPKWALVANRVRTRNSGQCAKRWNDALNPAIDRSGWTREEDEQLLKAVEEHGHSWANIARTSLPGRTGLAAKNRYNHLMRGACRQGSRRTRRASTLSSAPGRRRTRGGSISTIAGYPSSSSASSWSSSLSSTDGSESGTAPSTPRSFMEGDEMHAHTAGKSTDNVFVADSTAPLPFRMRFSSPVPSMPPISDTDTHFADLFMTSAVLGHPELPSSAPGFYDISPGYPSCTYEPPPDLFGDAGQMDILALWSPRVSGTSSPADSPFGDPVFSASQLSSSLYDAVSPCEASTLPLHGQDSHAAGMLMAPHYADAQCSSTHACLKSSYLTQAAPDLSSALRDVQVTVGRVPAFPDKASIQLTQPAADPSDRRVAVAVAICDQQDILSTVHSLSESLSSMLGQGQLPAADDCSLPPLDVQLPPEGRAGLWQP